MNTSRPDGALDLIGGAEVFRYERIIVRPLPVARSSDANVRTGWVVALYDKHADAVGYGEVAPLVFDHEVLRQIESDLVDAISTIWFHSRSTTLSLSDVDPSIHFGTTSALAELRAVANGTAMHRHFDRDAAGEIDVNTLIDVTTPDESIDRLLAEGYNCFKVKVGRGTIDDDARYVRRVRERTDGALLRLDANRAWTMEEACAFFERTSDVDIDYIEEPLVESDRLAELFYRVGWPLALDESVSELIGGHVRDGYLIPHLDDTLMEIARYAGAIVLKPTQLGSPYLAVSIAEGAAGLGIRPVISSSFESGFGLRTLAALAASSACVAQPAGLATQDFFATDACVPPFALGSHARIDSLVDDSVSPAPDLESVKQWGVTMPGR